MTLQEKVKEILSGVRAFYLTKDQINEKELSTQEALEAILKAVEEVIPENVKCEHCDFPYTDCGHDIHNACAEEMRRRVRE